MSMKSLKFKLFEYRQGLNHDQSDIVNIVSEHIDLCDTYSEKEVFGSLQQCLETYTYIDSVKMIMEEIDTELSGTPLLYSLKDLYSKIYRKSDRFLYEKVLSDLTECINENSDQDRMVRVLDSLKAHSWIPEISFFLSEVVDMPQEKQNYLSDAGKIEDVYSIVLQLKEGYLTYITGKWFLMSNEGISNTLLETHVKDETLLRKYRLLEQAIDYAQFEDDKINFNIAEELTITFDTVAKKMLINNETIEEGSTLETMFNSPMIPFVGKGYYPVLNETFINLDKFMKIDTVKRVYSLINPTFECYVFNFNGKMAQYRIDKRLGQSIYTYENAMPLIENVAQELGADLTFFFEDLLSEELKAIKNLEKQEKTLVEKLNDVENAILLMKEEKELLKENKNLETLYNTLLSKKHKISESIKTIKNEKNKLMN